MIAPVSYKRRGKGIFLSPLFSTFFTVNVFKVNRLIGGYSSFYNFTSANDQVWKYRAQTGFWEEKIMKEKRYTSSSPLSLSLVWKTKLEISADRFSLFVYVSYGRLYCIHVYTILFRKAKDGEKRARFISPF